MKRFLFVIAGIICLGSFSYWTGIFSSAEDWQQVLQKSNNLEGYFYKTPYKMSRENIGIMKVWHQGYASRIEMENTQTGEVMILITRQTEGSYYQIDPVAEEAIAFTYTDVELLPQDLDETRYAVAGSRFDQNFINRVSSVTEQEYLGEAVFLLENRSVHGGQEEIYRVWISKEFGLPVKEEMKMADGRIHRRIYTDMKEGPFPSELFEIPDSVKIIDTVRFN